MLLFATAGSYAGPHDHRSNHVLLSRAKDFERAAVELHRVIDVSLQYNNSSRFSSSCERDRRSRANSFRQLRSLGAAIDDHSAQLVRSVRAGKTGRYLSSQIRYLEEDLNQLSRMSLNRPIRMRLFQTKNALQSLESSCNLTDSHRNHGRSSHSSGREFERERYSINSNSGRERFQFHDEVLRAKRVSF
ncbi:MAG: hypothetical protein AAGH89_09690 [Verrucomicrobiota bacterium]